MKNKKLFDETVSILVDAYLKETLIHQDCTACAVGNIVARKLYHCDNIPQELSFRPFGGAAIGWLDIIDPFSNGPIIEAYKGLAKEQIDSTGYTPNEIFLIEKAFESVNNEDDPDGYYGLMKVVDVLCKIHECEQSKEETKLKFTKV